MERAQSQRQKVILSGIHLEALFLFRYGPPEQVHALTGELTYKGVWFSSGRKLRNESVYGDDRRRTHDRNKQIDLVNNIGLFV